MDGAGATLDSAPIYAATTPEMGRVIVEVGRRTR